MSLFSKLFGIAFAVGLVGITLYVVFGQVTVRKLRKNPATKDHLGIEFASGWDILNVAQALSLPRKLVQKMESNPFPFLVANSELLYKHTSKLDRFLARLFYWTFTLGGVSMICLAALDGLGFF